MRRFWSDHRTAVLHWGMEIVVVGIGVLLALSVQQWAEARASRQRATAAEERVRNEVLFGNITWQVERLAVYPCLKQRLAELSRGLITGGSRWQTVLPFADKELTLRRVYRVPSRNSMADALRGAFATGDLYSVSPERAADFSIIYNSFTSFDKVSEEEAKVAAGLNILQFPGYRTTAERNALLADVSRLDQLNVLINLIVTQSLKSATSLGLHYTAAEIAFMKKGRWWPNTLAETRAIYGSCVDPRAILAVDPRLYEKPTPTDRLNAGK